MEIPPEHADMKVWSVPGGYAWRATDFRGGDALGGVVYWATSR